jgi:hypothetical protein
MTIVKEIPNTTQSEQMELIIGPLTAGKQNRITTSMIFVVSRKSRLPKRAPDVWESARFQAVCVLEVDSVKMALSAPHQ